MDTNEHELTKLIQQGESLVLEFKSDRKPLPDRELVVAVVSLANTEGGALFIGVEDDGTATGLHETHRNISSLPALIGSRTNPALPVRVQKLTIADCEIARIDVPKARQIVATSDGGAYRRQIKFDGTPEAVPFYPHEFIQRQSSLGQVDPSALVLDEVTAEQFDPLQRLRIRNAIKKFGGDSTLLTLSDEEFDAALGLSRTVDGIRRPTVTGLLLLVADPRSRNPLLADAIKRIGLAERTGRGIDRIFEGMLRYGRPAPDYSMSNDYTVSLFLSNVAADLDFLKMVVEQEDKLGNMPIDSLIILSRLREERRLTTADLAPSVQKPEPNVRATLEKLVETGFLEPHGAGRGRTYTLSAKLYRRAVQKAEYIRQAGFAPIQQEQMVLSYIKKHGSIKRGDVAELCHLSLPQAYRLLKKLQNQGSIVQKGEMRHAFYTRNA